MNLKPILILIVIAAILSVSIVAAYENVENNSNNGPDDAGNIDVPAHHELRHSLHNKYTVHKDEVPKNNFTVDGYISGLLN